MPRYKAKIKDHRMLVVVKSSFGEKFDEKQIGLLQQSQINGLLRLSERKRDAIELMGPVGVSLTEWLKTPITKNDFFFVMLQVAELVRDVLQRGLRLSNVILDKKYVFINKNTRMLYFVYVPVETELYGANRILTFIEEICSAKPVKEDDMDYALRFRNYVESVGKYDAVDVERYIRYEAPNVITILRKHIYYRKETSDNEEITTLLSSNSITDDDGEEKTVLLQTFAETLVGYEEPTTLLKDTMKEEESCEETTTLLQRPIKESGYCEETTMLLQESLERREGNEEVTTLLKAQKEKEYSSSAYLYRVKTGEKISIDKPIIRIGKEPKSCDYCVLDNGRVSRIHADIIKRGAEWYLCDLGAVNRTYLEGEVLLPSREYPLAAGQHIKLADEEFVVYIK